ncbi:MAG: ACP S-malonyltransferase [Candidatus Izemoplasmatales bacterium]
MPALAILFPGQGAQHPGMGIDWLDDDPGVAKTLDEASRILGYDLSAVLSSEDGSLDDTLLAQPAIVISSLIAYKALLRRHPLKPAAFAGFSLGEWTALGAAGVYDFESLLRLVGIRAAAMQAAAKERPGAMAAILGLSEDRLKEVCAVASTPTAIVVPANLNCPGQIVISGDAEAVAKAAELAKQAGAKRIVPLNVSGAFHSPLMSSAAERLARALENAEPFFPAVPVWSNVTAAPHRKGELRKTLVRQVLEPVRFEDTIRALVASGIGHFLEIGPGSVLSGFIRKIDPTAAVARLDGPDGLPDLERWLTEHGFVE